MTETLCLHASSDSADFLYATGMAMPDPAFWFKKGHRSYLLVSPLELGRAKRQARVTHVIDQAAWQRRLKRRLGRAPSRLEVIADVLHAKKVSGVAVPADFPVATADAIRGAGIAVAVRDGSFFPDRVIKTDDELAAIRAAQAATERSLDAALDVLRAARARNGLLSYKGERVTSELLRSVIDVSLARDGCVARHTIIASGEQCVDPHDVGSGPISTNASIIFDIFPRHTESGYFADMSRTVVRGKASRELRDMYATVAAGQQYAFDRIRGGCDARAIHRGIHRLFDDAGWSTTTANGRPQGFFHGTGHGVGLDIHEAPSFGNRESTLPAGAVVTVEPGLYYSGIGGVRLEDMVLVTDDGCENLTGYPKQLEL